MNREPWTVNREPFIRPDCSLSSDSRILIIQPSPYGLLFTSAGSASSRALISSTSPLSGENSSDTAFTASMVPKTSCFLYFAPTFGSSTNTMSPSSPCAKSVMPM